MPVGRARLRCLCDAFAAPFLRRSQPAATTSQPCCPTMPVPCLVVAGREALRRRHAGHAGHARSSRAAVNDADGACFWWLHAARCMGGDFASLLRASPPRYAAMVAQGRNLADTALPIRSLSVQTLLLTGTPVCATASWIAEVAFGCGPGFRKHAPWRVPSGWTPRAPSHGSLRFGDDR